VTHLSIQNGVTLCADCAELHMDNLPSETHSFVRPLESPLWREDQIQPFLMGGNQRMREYLMQCNTSCVNLEKYNSNAAVHYRLQILKPEIAVIEDDFVLVDEDFGT
jgi:hypothetical protein